MFHPVKIIGSAAEIYIDKSVRDYILDLDRERERLFLTQTDIETFAKSFDYELTNYSLQKLAVSPTVREISSHPNSLTENTDYPKIRVHVVIDETPFFHARYLDFIATESKHVIITGATVVKLPNGGKLQHYLTRNLFNLGLLNFLILGLKSSFLKGCSLVLSRFGFRMYGSVKEIVIANGIPFKCVSSLTDPGYFKF